MTPIISSAEVLGPYIMERRYTNAAFNRAGDFIASRGDEWLQLIKTDFQSWNARFSKEFGIMAEWRNLHAMPLKAVSALLSSEATNIDGAPIVVERLKRYLSIRSKLQRFPVTNLTTIQDIAGCRAVVQDVRHAYELRDRIVQRFGSRSDGPQIVPKWCRDYIAEPKPDGYRSIHEVAKFYSLDPSVSHCNDLRVEIQIRSRMQHAWAMAVETASAVTNQALKSGDGEALWKRFFFLVAEIMAFNEGTQNVFANKEEHFNARREASGLATQLRVVNLLSGMQHVLESYSTFEGKGGNDLYLLELHAQNREIGYMGYGKEDFKKASEEYAEKEQANRNNEDIHIVLVTAESLSDLKSAYPSFFLNSVGFIDLINEQVFGS
ncbi:RelA/SpoT domain-containing protein [Alloacidobacterium dinghuense]|uniref:RelA/SpoT domain-containing protein n=1 Tax=Alloacidobacterium dinghuense TaxID=2763107 RepID=A0A7G8BP53_9BACT|nr:RelA/SpoT domain-containing protein [Alloacidobacterium dinghuense]QNI34323.1 RelA/SpoT domain-containing protein [Alloacidobacterium dinghuense]